MGTRGQCPTKCSDCPTKPTPLHPKIQNSAALPLFLRYVVALALKLSLDWHFSKREKVVHYSINAIAVMVSVFVASLFFLFFPPPLCVSFLLQVVAGGVAGLTNSDDAHLSSITSNHPSST